jgi:hypothetical protein
VKTDARKPAYSKRGEERARRRPARGARKDTGTHLGHAPKSVASCGNKNPRLRGLPNRGDRTRTCNPRFWRPVLCQIELRPWAVRGPECTPLASKLIRRERAVSEARLGRTLPRALRFLRRHRGRRVRRRRVADRARRRRARALAVHSRRARSHRPTPARTIRAPSMMGLRRKGCDGRCEARTQGAFVSVAIRARLRTPPRAVQRGPAAQRFIVEGALGKLRSALSSYTRGEDR